MMEENQENLAELVDLSPTFEDLGEDGSSPLTDSFHCSVPFEEIYNSEKRINDPFPELVTFPEDNLDVITYKKFQDSEYGPNVFVSRKTFIHILG